jgi:diaminopimelate decarboxylase
MNNLVAALTKKHFSESKQTLVIGAIAVQELAETYGTPLYAYDRGVLDKTFTQLRDALPPRFSIHYSIKANPGGPILRYFLGRGCGLEVASGGEFARAVAAGCAPERILFAGPAKTEEELTFVLANGIGEIHMESLVEAGRIAAICRRLHMRARVAIRVNPVGDAEGGAMRMGGRAIQFGVDEETLDEVLDSILAKPELDFCGIHLFTGTQILDAEVLLRQYHHGLRLARRLSPRLGRPLRTLDFGGGLGIPYFAHEKELDLAVLKKGLETLCAEVNETDTFAGTQFIVEPGRFLTAEAGVYVTRVVDIKVSRGKKFVIVDGGMNHHLAASGNLGQTIKRNYPVALLNKLDNPGEELVDVVGPLCTPLDSLARGISLSHVEIGDLVGIFQSGAYARSASPLGFLSRPAPHEIWIDGRTHRLVPYQDRIGLSQEVAVANT